MTIPQDVEKDGVQTRTLKQSTVTGDHLPTPLVSHRLYGSPSSSAVISPCGLYRYRLERSGLAGAGAIAWIMVNPSTADATADDATIRRVIGFTERLGGGWAIVGNKFAYRATDIKELRRVSDPRGPDNDQHLAEIMRSAPIVIAAWGPLAKLPDHLRKRWRTVCRIADEAGATLMCLGTAQDGQPRHPLMLASDTPLTPWERPR